MLYHHLEIIAKGLFGSSWKKQLADNLFVDHRRIQDWSKRNTPLPDFIERELVNISKRRKEEIQFSSENITSIDYHKYAILTGEVHHLDEDRLTEDEISIFINSQKYTALQECWKLKLSGYTLDELTSWAESFILEENDIASWCENNDYKKLNFEEVQYMRSDNLSDTINTIKNWF